MTVFCVRRVGLAAPAATEDVVGVAPSSGLATDRAVPAAPAGAATGTPPNLRVDHHDRAVGHRDYPLAACADWVARFNHCGPAGGDASREHRFGRRRRVYASIVSIVVVSAFAPNGAQDRSHGWSEAQPVVAVLRPPRRPRWGGGRADHATAPPPLAGRESSPRRLPGVPLRCTPGYDPMPRWGICAAAIAGFHRDDAHRHVAMIVECTRQRHVDIDHSATRSAMLSGLAHCLPLSSHFRPMRRISSQSRAVPSNT